MVTGIVHTRITLWQTDLMGFSVVSFNVSHEILYGVDAREICRKTTHCHWDTSKVSIKLLTTISLILNILYTRNLQKILTEYKLQVWQCHLAIGQISRVFANGPGDRGSILGRVIPKTQKMVLDAALPSTQHYKVRIKSKVKQSREWSSALPYTSV